MTKTKEYRKKKKIVPFSLDPILLLEGPGLLIDLLSINSLSCCSWHKSLVAQWHAKSSHPRGLTRVPCIDRQTLIYCATREVLYVESWGKIPSSAGNFGPGFQSLQLIEWGPLTNGGGVVICFTYSQLITTAIHNVKTVFMTTSGLVFDQQHCTLTSPKFTRKINHHKIEINRDPTKCLYLPHCSHRNFCVFLNYILGGRNAWE